VGVMKSPLLRSMAILRLPHRQLAALPERVTNPACAADAEGASPASVRFRDRWQAEIPAFKMCLSRSVCLL
jgi:hypothetical protein